MSDKLQLVEALASNENALTQERELNQDTNLVRILYRVRDVSYPSRMTTLSEPRESVRKRVQSNNETVLADLVKQLRSPLGVIPFLGAGISAFKYRQWGDFLKAVASDRCSSTESARINEAVDAENFLLAAKFLTEVLGAQDFQQAIADEFSEDKLDGVDLTAGMFGLLPLITAGPVITTNFDRVTEQIFEKALRPFKNPVFGANPHEVIPAIQQNRPVLWKMHGDYLDTRTRVFNEAEYEQHYKELPNLLLVAFLNRPALFIGCSLDIDRTTEVLTTIRAAHPATYHFGFAQIPDTDKEFEDRVKLLRTMGVRPIWYPKNDHAHIERHLSDLVHDMSSIRLPTARREPPKETKLKPDDADQRYQSQLAETARSVRFEEEKYYSEDAPSYAVILDKIAAGQVAFFLGSGVTMERLPLGNQFYANLVSQFDENAGGPASDDKYGQMNAKRVTQHFADRYGRKALYSRVAQQLATKQPEPTAIHWFLASLTGRLRSKGFKAAPLWILTTNYDEWMEHTLGLSGQPFHLFTYRVSDPYAGSFIYQSPSGTVRLIDQPALFRRLPEDEPVVVKLHGGFHRDINLPTSYAFIQRDFVELGGKMPAALPRVILDRLAERSLLFLGSGLGDDSIEAVVRELHRADPEKYSWAVQRPAPPENQLYWGTLGVEIIDIRLGRFILELDRKLDSVSVIPGQ